MKLPISIDDVARLIPDYYLTVSQDAVDEYIRLYGVMPRVLKCDVYNELFTTPILGNLDNINSVVCIDHSGNFIEQAREKYPDGSFWLGDIRNIPTLPNRFDVILDLSTIDHIQPYELGIVLAEYQRVLSPGGLCLLVVWTHPERDIVFHGQSYFQQDMVLELADHYFERLSGPVWVVDDGDQQLWQFLLMKE